MLTALPDCLFHKITHHANHHAVLVRLSQSNHEMRARMRKMIPELSARRLQRFWRWCRLFASTKCLAARFELTKLTHANASAMEFVPLSLHLRLNWVIRTSELYLNRVQTLFGRATPPNPNDLTPCLSTPTILSAYLMGCHPNGVFETMGEIETALHHTSATVIRCIDTITTHIQKKGSLHDLLAKSPAALHWLLVTYQHTLHTWMDPNHEAMLARIIQRLQDIAVEGGDVEMVALFYANVAEGGNAMAGTDL